MLKCVKDNGYQEKKLHISILFRYWRWDLHCKKSNTNLHYSQKIKIIFKSKSLVSHIFKWINNNVIVLTNQCKNNELKAVLIFVLKRKCKHLKPCFWRRITESIFHIFITVSSYSYYPHPPHKTMGDFRSFRILDW